jgi:hypothetical protein
MRVFILVWMSFLAVSHPAVLAQDWVNFDKYHGSITRKEFCRLLDEVYNPSKKIYEYLVVTDQYVEFYQDTQKATLDYTLEFAPPGTSPVEPRQTFKTISDLRRIPRTPGKPLKGIRISIDPGHIGGKWASLEERSVKWGKNPPIREGDCNLIVAHHLKKRLEKEGAEVYLTHATPDPVTPLRAKDFVEEARQTVYKEQKIAGEPDPKRKRHLEKLINWRAELYFYRRAEIEQRAINIREQFLPDLNICNHFNATERSGEGKLVKDNRHAFFINGCYGPDEVVNPLTRYFLFSKLLEQCLPIEMAVSNEITRKMLRIASLPPVRYGREKYQIRVNENPYLYARNLAASRQYPGPCIILEPFYMNNPWTAARLAAGDYDGYREIDGVSYRSLYREYSDSVAEAIIEAYGRWMAPPAMPASPL